MVIDLLLKSLAKLPTPLSPPRLKDRIVVKGLKRRVIVHFDSAGIPHIIARSAYDLFFSQGFILARDRLWQMDFLRRATSGNLSEIFGDRPVDYKPLTTLFKDRSIVDLDYFIRCFGLRRAAARSLARLSAEAFDALTAFSDGVNACINYERLPPEFMLLKYTPEPWSPQDSLTILRGVGLELNISWRTVLVNQLLLEKFHDQADLREILPTYTNSDAVTANFNIQEMLPVEELLKIEDWHRFFSATDGAYLGSNAWAAGGRLTATGKPILCNDPHLSLYAPSSWFACHLNGAGFDVAGITPAGIPGVAIGHNRRIAWGITASYIHDADCFVEEVDPKNPNQYYHHDKIYPFQLHPQKIFVRGKILPIEKTVRISRNGPIISDVIELNNPPKYVYALRWTGHEGTREVDAFLNISRATGFESFRDACKMNSVPGLNLVYADIEGNIGYQLAASVPIRKKGSNNFPVPARYDEYQWEGYVPFEKLPCLYNPQRGFVASANNKITDDNYPYFLSDFWEPYHRYERICLLLSNRRNLTLEDMRNIQNDQFSSFARNVIEAVIKPWFDEGGAGANFGLENAAKELLSWDCVTRPISNAALIFHLFYLELMKEIFREKFGDELFEKYFDMFNNSVMPVENIFKSPASSWFLNLDRHRIVTRALERAVNGLTLRFGNRMEDWQWGRLHKLYMRHRLHSHPFFRKHFSIGPFETGGDPTTLNLGYFNYADPFNHIVGASARIIFDLGNWDNTLIVLNTGQSGHPLSTRYRDHAEKWARGEYFRFPYQMSSVELYPKTILDPRS
ncbi:MAG: penicillin acylase family protein [Myxococcota bacterium]